MDYYKLIALYDYIYECYNTELCWHCQRFSNNSKPDFTDEELLTIYIFCIVEEEKFKLKSIYNFTYKYLHSWFPKLPSYQAFCNRLNRLASVLPVLAACFLREVNHQGARLDISLLDSMPIITCSGKRAGKVAPQLTDKGYCSTKKLHYFGAKLHSIAFHRPGKLPIPEFLSLSKASEHDLNAVREILPQLKNRALIGDKAYSKEDFNEVLQKEAGSCIYTPVKLVKGETQAIRQFKHAADKLFSTEVSRIRQPIESLFNWIIEKTDIQRASKVRSRQGLIVHVFGRIAAAISFWVF
ncbi:MAG: transposase [Saprospiraceae bacterium]|nr:transposase [Saprospiraceae bacterium]